jgi:asparagine synthase (glutamine-hydrolysing)
MCGIAGIYDASIRTLTSIDEGKHLLNCMNETMVHRGPDAHGMWSDETGRCHLAHRRLSIIDTSDAGRQPMLNGSGRWVISFNGEIYNFQEIRPQLESTGIQLRGRTDTEVLIEAIALWGIDALQKLDGMFAFAAFDRESGELLLARDPFGEKPLYYMELGKGGLVFASELQALEALPWFDGEVSLDAIGELLMFQYIGAPRTIYQAVKKLEPGCWLHAKPDGRIERGRYFEFKPGHDGFIQRPINDLVDELEDILTRSVRRRLISDVPLGAFLSGGVDSSTVCALVHNKLGRPLKTFSIGFADSPESEHEAARMFAKHLGTEHHDQILTPHTSDFLLDIGRLLDEPNADSSCMPTYLLSEYARRFVTVALSGDGGDEMFCGYGRYFATLDDDQRWEKGMLPNWNAGRAYYGNRILVSEEAHVEELFGFVPDALAAHLTRLRGEIDHGEAPLISRLRKTDTDNYMPGAVLPKVDRMSMRHSMEVRTPFLNVELARFAEKLPPKSLYDNGRGKIILRELACRYLPREWIDTPKKGFGIPMTLWARDELLNVANQLLDSDDSRLRQSFGADNIARFMARQRSSDGFATYQVWALTMLESWARNHPAKLPDVVSIAASRPRSLLTTQPASKPSAASPIASATGIRLCLRKLRFHGNRLRRALKDIYSLVIPTRLPPNMALLAYRINPHCLLVMEREDFVSLRTLDEHEAMHLINRIRELLVRLRFSNEIELAGEEADKAEANLNLRDDQFFPLPGWWSRFPGVFGNFPLTMTTLLFFGENAPGMLDYPTLERLRRLGAKDVIFPHPHRPFSTLVHLSLQKKCWYQEWRDIKKLRTQAIRLGWQKTNTRVPKHKFIVGGLVTLPNLVDTELLERYMLLEGAAQMPPVPTSHEEIETLGKGRYSIWNQHCLFSASSPKKVFASEYWLVENNERNQPLLPISLKLVEFVFNQDDSRYAEKLERYIKNRDAAKPCYLEPGDPVVIVTHGLPPGGAERQWCYLAIGLKKRGYDVSFVVTDSLYEGDNRHYLPLLEKHGLDVLELGGMSFNEILGGLPNEDEAWSLIHPEGNPHGINLARLTRLFTKQKPKAVFCQLDYTNLMAGAAGHIAGVPRIVMSFRNYNPTHFPYLCNDWFLPLYRILARSPSTILSGNATDANIDYAQWIGIPPEQVRYIPNAIDPAIIARPSQQELAALRQALDLADDTPVILGVFRLSDEKDPMLFLEVCAQLIRVIPKMRVFIAGVGPMQARMKVRIGELGIDNNLTLLGRRSDIAALMCVATLLLSTSSLEGMSNAIMEAQLLGRPVVATRTGATPDIVVDGTTGYIRESGDLHGLVEACLAILKDPILANTMSETATHRIMTEFTVALLTERHIRLINETTP